MVPESLVVKRNDSELTMELPGNRVIALKGSDSEDSLRGVPPDGLILEETDFQRPSVWFEVLRPRCMVKRTPVLFISTPKGRRLMWLLERQHKNDPDWAFFHHTSYDNPLIPKEEIAKLKTSMSERAFRQEVLAEYDCFTGLVYAEFEPKVNIIPAFELSPLWPRFEGMDWGTANPTAFLFCARNPETGDVYFYDEHYQSRLEPERHAPEVLMRRRGLKPVASVADPTVFRKERDMGCVADDFGRHGIWFTPGQARPKSRAIGIVSSYLTGSGGPRVYFFEGRMPNTIREFSMYEYDAVKDEANAKEDPRSSNNHACNALEYVLTYIHDLYAGKKVGKEAAAEMFPKITPELRKQIDAQYAALSRLPMEPERGESFDKHTGYLS